MSYKYHKGTVPPNVDNIATAKYLNLGLPTQGEDDSYKASIVNTETCGEQAKQLERNMKGGKRL